MRFEQKTCAVRLFNSDMDGLVLGSCWRLYGRAVPKFPQIYIITQTKQTKARDTQRAVIQGTSIGRSSRVWLLGSLLNAALPRTRIQTPPWPFCHQVGCYCPPLCWPAMSTRADIIDDVVAVVEYEPDALGKLY